MKKLFYFCLLSFSLVSNSFGNDDKIIIDTIIRKLVEHGFENVRVKAVDKTLIIAYENRVYRFDHEAVKEVLKIVTYSLDDEYKIILVPENRKIPIVAIEVSAVDCKKYFNSEISGEEFSERFSVDFNTDRIFNEIQKEEMVNSSSFRFDLALRPQLKFEFGPFEKPIISQVNIVPVINTSLWKGMSFNYELILPLYNDFNIRDDSVRPGLIALNQVLRLDNDYFLSFSLGYFTQNRYGFDFELKKYFYNGDLNIGLNLGSTSIASFSGMSRLNYYDAFTWTGSLSCEYRLHKYDLTFGLSAGKYLLGDESMRLDLSREFGETEIGFFVLHSAKGISNGGINVTIPLFPSQYWKPNIIRLRTNENFSTSYLVKTNSDQFIGLRYNTGNRLGIFNKKLNPKFIRSYFSRN